MACTAKIGKSNRLRLVFPLHFFRALPLPVWSTTEQSTVEASLFVKYIITYGAKLLNAGWLRQRAFFLNHEGMVSWSLSWFPASNGFWKISETRHFWVWTKHGYFILTWKRINVQRSAVFWWKSRRIFPTKTGLIRSLKNVWVGTAGVARDIVFTHQYYIMQFSYPI